jgi:hypothetical protein
MGTVVTGVIQIDPKRLPAALQRNEEALRAAIARGLTAGLHRGRAIMVRATPTDQGQLRASWEVARVTNSAGGIAKSGNVGELRNRAPHAGIVELGARPHGLSPAGWMALYEWVRRHSDLWGATRMNRAGDMLSGPVQRSRRARTAHARGPLKPYQGPDPVITAITNAIAAKLRREGQKPTYFIRNNLFRVGDAVAQEIRREIDHLVESAGGYGGS